MKKIIALTTLTSVLFSCSTNHLEHRSPASLIEVSPEFDGKNFFEENEKFSIATLLGKHEIATFIKWARKNPIKLYEVLRKESPIFETGEIPNVLKYLTSEEKENAKWKKTVVVTLDDDVREVLNNPSVFSVKLYRDKMDNSVGKFMLGYDQQKVNEEKKWMRSILKREDLPKVKRIVEDLTNKAISEGNVNGRIDLVNAIARRVPIELTEKYFGFEIPDMRSMYKWSRNTQYSFFHNADNKEEYEQKAVESGKEMHEYLKKLLKKKRTDRSFLKEDTVLARLLKADIPDGELLDLYDGRVRTNIIGTLVGGVETTQAAIVQVVDFFLKNPKILAKAREAAIANNDDLVAKFVWEALRFKPVNPFVMRYAEKDFTIAKGTPREYNIQRGQVVLVGTQSAMFDESKVVDSNKFRIDRGGVNEPNSIYYHFGYGHHKCLGDYVAEVEVPEIVKQILKLPELKRMNGGLGKLAFHDNVGATEVVEDKSLSQFPESLIVQFNSPIEKNQLTLADPRFTFEDYLMDYDREFFRRCLSSNYTQSTLKNIITSIPINMKRRKEFTDVEDLLVCRLSKNFHNCIGGMKGNNYVSMYGQCKRYLSPIEQYFFQTEILNEAPDYSKLPALHSIVNNSGYKFEEDLKFYDRADYRQTFMNPMAAKSFPVQEQYSAKQLIFYARVDLEFRKCIAPNVLIKKMTRAQAFDTCMQKEDIKLDDLTAKYYREIILNQETEDADVTE